MNHVRIGTILPLLLALACSREERDASASAANAGIDSMNARLVQAHRNRDPQAYAALYTDSGVFEWPAFNTVRGRASLAAMARGNFGMLRNLDLQLTVASRKIAADHATEFGAFRESWNDSSGARMSEYGRYAVVLVRQPDNSWRMEHFLGFEDSVRTDTPAKPRR